jgi:hypothetical protein
MKTPQKVTGHVIPAKAGIYNDLKIMDSRLPGNDINGPDSIVCETLKDRTSGRMFVGAASNRDRMG